MFLVKMLNFFKNVANFKIFLILIICLALIRSALFACSEDEWTCDDGSCIREYQTCDGKVECADGSEEIAENCIHLYKSCPRFAFKCSYGACITGSYRCNNRTDCADNSDELSCYESSELRLRGHCSTEEMECLNSKECISRRLMCDGKRDCSDGSDETVEVCGDYSCSPVEFHCGYGGCISGNAPCNGVIECLDGSDEAWELCQTPRKAIGNRPSRSASTPKRLPCEIPKDLSRVNIQTLTTKEPLFPGSLADDDATVQVECASKKGIARDLLCQDGIWLGEFPKCNVYCSGSELEGLSTVHRCTLYGTENNNLCSDSVVTNTTITFYCAYGYIKTEVQSFQEISCQPDGQYDKPRRVCKQNCGILSTALDYKLTKNAYQIKPSRSPWHVAIFRDDEDEQTQICGGSIISPSLIVSAAHCFWNISGPTIPHLYRIGAGKLTNKYHGDESEGSPQIREVERIYISADYNDVKNNYYADIAILKLKKPLHYNENVSSVCLHERNNDARDYVASGVEGSITGYGRNGLMKRIQMTTISSEQCRRLPGGNSLATDNFCLDNHNVNSTLCRGDGGGGFVEYINGAFYLLGVVSYTPVMLNNCAAAAFVGLSNMRYIRPDLYAIMIKELENDKKLF